MDLDGLTFPSVPARCRHPPTYYLPPDSVAPELKLETESKHTFCEVRRPALLR